MRYVTLLLHDFNFWPGETRSGANWSAFRNRPLRRYVKNVCRDCFRGNYYSNFGALDSPLCRSFKDVFRSARLLIKNVIIRANAWFNLHDEYLGRYLAALDCTRINSVAMIDKSFPSSLNNLSTRDYRFMIHLLEPDKPPENYISSFQRNCRFNRK